jgi:hypothetical protein
MPLLPLTPPRARARRYVAAKKPVIGKKKKRKRPSIAEVTFKGFNHDGSFDPAAITDIDKEKEAEARSLVSAWWTSRADPAMGWSPLLKPDRSPLDMDVKGVHRYVREKPGQALFLAPLT